MHSFFYLSDETSFKKKIFFQRLIFGPKARKAFPHIPDVNMLLDLLPHSNSKRYFLIISEVLPNLHFPAGSSYRGKYYRIKDIVEIGTEWATLKNKGNDHEISEFKERRKSDTENIMTSGAFCNTWSHNMFVLKRKQNKEAREAKRNECVALLF